MTTTKTDEIALRQLERMTFFSDAVFAIAMTLLVIEVRLPHLSTLSEVSLGQALVDLIPNYIGFLVSFLVLGRFWMAHHNVMGALKATTPRLVRTNLILLLAVAFMPFPTAIISEYVELRVGIGFYTGWLVVLGFVNHRLIVAASDPVLAEDGVDPALFARYRRASLIPLLIGAIAFAAGMIAPVLALVALVVGAPLISWLVWWRIERVTPTG